MEIFQISHDLAGLALTAFLLGARHGFDADHLAAIDSLSRARAAALVDGDSRQAPGRSRLASPAIKRMSAWLANNAGLQFSLGHGTVVLLVALMVTLLSSAWQVPPWIESAGAWISIAILTTLALMNLALVLRTPPGEMSRLAGWRRPGLPVLAGGGVRWAGLGVGALFAISFDTLSQAALFGVAALRLGGWQPAALLAGLFVLGMVVTDGINGFWIARLLRRSGRMALVASRVMGLAVAGVSLLTAALGMAAQLLHPEHPLAAARGAWFSLAIIAVVGASFLLGRRLAGMDEDCAHATVAGQISPAARRGGLL